ncbi:MAG: adenosine deaminase family protein [bacterium]|nr:adenosine deaminase family protein [bacterium]
MRATYSAEFIRRIPKTDLHVHLDGSIRVSTLIELAREARVALPSETDEGLNHLVFKDCYNSLEEYLQGFKYTVAVLQTPEALERVAYEFAWDNFREGVRYFEVRFAPQLHINARQNIETVVESVNRGLARATKEFNETEAIRSGAEPEAHYAIIACAMRAFFKGMSEYYNAFLELHRFSKHKRIYHLASLELVQAMIKLRDELGIPVVALDIAGPEAGFPPHDHEDAFDLAHHNFFKKTVHAGEAYGPESIFEAITRLHADRIGHGYHLFSTELITDASIRDRERYVRNLCEYIADRRITIEVCLTSNLQTNPQIADIRRHAFQRMCEERLSVTLCTDNRTVSKTTVSREIALAIEAFDLSPGLLRDIIIYGFKRSFFPRPYREKRAYVRRVIDFYDGCAAAWGVGIQRR